MSTPVPATPRAHVLTWLVFISISWLFLFVNTQRHFARFQQSEYGTIEEGWPLTFSSVYASVFPQMDERAVQYAEAAKYGTGATPLQLEGGFAIPVIPGKTRITWSDIFKPLASFLVDACVALAIAFLSASFCEALCRRNITTGSNLVRGQEKCAVRI